MSMAALGCMKQPLGDFLSVNDIFFNMQVEYKYHKTDSLIAD